MSISTDWYDEEHRVIYQKFEGTWTWDELGRDQAQIAAFAKSVPYNLVLFTDMRETNIMPKGNVLAQGKSSIAHLPENVSQIIIVIQSRLIEVFAGLVFDMMPGWRNRVRFVKTIEEGRKLVEEAVTVNATR
jgi:hypothetical protein